LSSATLIRLGQLALDYGQTLYNKKAISEREWQSLNESDRPCMVGKKIAVVPCLPIGWQSSPTTILGTVDQNETVITALLQEEDRPMSVREIMRTPAGRRTNLKADEIRAILESTPGLKKTEVNGTQKYWCPQAVTTS
jgi:hypothetical protein